MIYLVRAAGIEPALPRERVFETRASTSSAMPAQRIAIALALASANSFAGVVSSLTSGGFSGVLHSRQPLGDGRSGRRLRSPF